MNSMIKGVLFGMLVFLTINLTSMLWVILFDVSIAANFISGNLGCAIVGGVITALAIGID